jgi:catechol 2,3-dioxygenase-like lactoylglutathione lyase family enzyme
MAVADAARTAAMHQAAFGFEVLHEGVVSEETARFYRLDQAGGRELVVGGPGHDRGFLRLIQVPASVPLSRPGGQAWDTGGIFDIDVRALGSIDEITARAVEAGFVLSAPITDYDFSGMQVREVVMTGLDGVAVAVIAQDDPPLTGFEAVGGPASWAFNSTQVVRSLEAAKAFFVGALGWKPVYETAWAHPGSGLNCLGLPLSVARAHQFKVGIYHPQGLNLGSVELLEIDGVEGMDFHAPPGALRRGIVSLRLPVSDLAGFLARATAGGAAIVAPPGPLPMAPWDAVVAAAVETPWGTRLDVYEPATR